MGIVRFSPPDLDLRPGYRFGAEIVDLTTVSLSSGTTTEQTDIESYLTDLDELHGSREALSSGRTYAVDAVDVHRPFSPDRFICLEGCYEHDLIDTGMDPHFEEAEMFTRDWPSLWCAPASSCVGPSESIRLPSPVEDAQPGVSVGLVVNRPAKNVNPNEAGEIIAGVVAFGLLVSHGEFPRLEGHRLFDTALQMGSEVVPPAEVSLTDMDVGLSVNGTEIDCRTTEDWRFSAAEMVAEASSVLSLQTGDVLLTGDPTRVERSLESGDRLSVTSPATLGTDNPVVRDGESV
jgi:2-keto-4-pentenoate hydratase/2-oxohepta-3-ene-1,7-dioic acid hydratase in catechol pathway